MFRIDDPSAAVALPTPGAAGTEGYFTEGNPGVTPATLVRADFLNMVQEELRAVVVAAALTPSKTTFNQVLTALNTLFQSTAVLSGSGYVKIPVVVAGVARTLIIQWASGTQVGSTTGTQPTITFPIAFPNACLFAHMSGRIVGATGILWAINSQTSTTTSATGYISSNGTTDQLIPQVLAIGW
jgi:hypothetical protein